MSRKLLAVVLAVMALTVSARAGDELLRLTPTEADLAVKRQDWFGLYMNGKKVGWFREEFGRAGDGDEAAYVSTSTGLFSLEVRGQTIEVQITKSAEFETASPYALRAARSEQKHEGGTEIVELHREGSGYSATISAGGTTRTIAVPAIDYTLADAMTQELWAKAGRAQGDTARVRDFSVSELKPNVTTFTVTGVKESLVAGVRTKFYEIAVHEALRGIESTATIDAAGRPIAAKLAGLFEIRAEPEETAKQIEKGGDLFVFGTARIDRPIGDPRHVKKLVIEVEGEGLDRIVEGPRQKVSRSEDGKTITLTLGPVTAPADTATAAEVAEALEETVDYPTKLPKVVELAKRAVGDAKTPAEKVGKLVRFVSEYVEDFDLPRGVPVSELITSRKGDCSEHALLFVTLARAAGVPAREVGGLMYMGDDVKAFGGHAWNEVALDGHWVPVDATWDEMTIDATHITLERNDRGMGQFATMGRLRFRLVGMSPEPPPTPIK